jgi:hypothetical protein
VARKIAGKVASSLPDFRGAGEVGESSGINVPISEKPASYSRALFPPEQRISAVDLIQAMYKKFEGKWYDKVTITQKVDFHKEGKVERTETWNEILELPGKVRSNIGPAEEGNCEIFIDGTYHWFREGELVQKRETQHVVLLLGFDVYVQDPKITLSQLEDAEFDLEVIRETVWNDRPVYVVGAEDGDEKTNQFWVDKEHLYFVRQIQTSAKGNVIDTQLSAFEKLERGWIATELVFKRNGEVVLAEKYLDYGVPDAIDPEVFNVDELKTQFEP